MVNKKPFIAMLLAGGQGSRLGALTKHIAKPAVSFGGKYRIIDFALSNCANSNIDTVGVLTQYRPYLLNTYIGTGSSWDLDSHDGGVAILPPYATETGGQWYAGTADAIYQNLDYINLYDPDYVIILSGDHIYRMDYRKMLRTHIENNADLTIAVMTVPWEEAPRLGILAADETGKIYDFEEKPAKPKSNLASMGIYIFSKKVLEDSLIADSRDADSEHDFGKNIIPTLLAQGKRLFVHRFEGFWKDVGTIPTFHETSMDLLEAEPQFDLMSEDFPTLTQDDSLPPHYVGPKGSVDRAFVANGSIILGRVEHSIISKGCTIEEGAEVMDSILLPDVTVEKGAKVVRAIVGEGATVKAKAVFGSADTNVPIAVVGDDAVVE